MAKSRSWGITGNQLKLIALVLMTLDHVGVFLLPQFPILRIVGRLAMPIFAYMIAEGCQHTRSKGKYLLRVALAAVLTQLVQYYMAGSLYQTTLVTFSFSLVLVITLEHARKNGGLSWLLLLGIGFGIWFVCEMLGDYLPGFGVDYDFPGVLLPVLISFGRDRLARFWLTAGGLALLCWFYGGVQWYAMATLVLLAFYSGRRGKGKLKWLFYLYFPAHLAVIYLLQNYLH